MSLGLGKLHRYWAEGAREDDDAEDEAATDGTARWSDTERVSVGLVLVSFAIAAAPALITRERIKRRTGSKGFATTYEMHITPALLDWAQEAMHRKALAATVHRPMLCPPLPHRGPTGGGSMGSAVGP